jgi:hypothetical protein
VLKECDARVPTHAVLKGIEDAQSRGTKPDEMEVRPVDHLLACVACSCLAMTEPPPATCSSRFETAAVLTTTHGSVGMGTQAVIQRLQDQHLRVRCESRVAHRCLSIQRTTRFTHYASERCRERRSA